MKILAVLNTSNADNLNCDSGFLFQAILGRSLVDAGHQYILVGAHSKEFPTKALDAYGLPAVAINLGTDKYRARLDLSWVEFRELNPKSPIQKFTCRLSVLRCVW